MYNKVQHYASLLTDFLPGIAHSQFIKLSVPSWFLTGRATNPYEKKHLNYVSMDATRKNINVYP